MEVLEMMVNRRQFHGALKAAKAVAGKDAPHDVVVLRSDRAAGQVLVCATGRYAALVAAVDAPHIAGSFDDELVVVAKAALPVMILSTAKNHQAGEEDIPLTSIRVFDDKVYVLDGKAQESEVEILSVRRESRTEVPDAEAIIARVRRDFSEGQSDVVAVMTVAQAAILSRVMAALGGGAQVTSRSYHVRDGLDSVHRFFAASSWWTLTVLDSVVHRPGEELASAPEASHSAAVSAVTVSASPTVGIS